MLKSNIFRHVLPLHPSKGMIKSAIEKVMTDDMAGIWNVLTAAQKRLVVDNFKIHNFKKNQIIYAEHEQPEFLWCLLKGKVKKYKEGVGGRQQIIRLLRPVQYFGYRAYFANEPYVSSSSAFEPSVVGALPLEIVKETITENNQVAWFFIHELSRNLGKSDSRIVNLTQKHIRARLAEALIALRDSYGYEDDGMTIKIYLSREDLANLSNMTTSNAIRTLSGFVAEKLVVVDGRSIRILQESMLRKISKLG